MTFPSTLYKFRDWNNPYHRRILSNSELFFANNKAFNDPYDFDLPILEFHPFDREWSKKAAYENEGIRLSVEDLNKMEKIWPSDPEDWPEDLKVKNEADKNEFKKYEAEMGIFCGSAENNNPLMWGHYANSHKGFCAGFDFNELINFIYENFTKKKSTIKGVNYNEEIPIINSLKQDKVLDYITSRMTTKSIDWKYENEYRIIIKNYNNKSLQIPNEIFTEVIFGLRMDIVSEYEIKAVCKERFPLIKFYKAKINNKEFKVDIVPCE